MKHLAPILLVVLGIVAFPEFTHAQFGWARRKAPACKSPSRCHCGNCEDGPYDKGPGPNRNNNPPPQREGVFVAPPRGGGAVEGATSAVGLNGITIRMPEWKISLPSIEFPSFSRYSRAPRMRIDEQYAPFVAHAGAGNRALYRGADAGGYGPQRSAGVGDARQRDLDAQVRALEESKACLERQMRDMMDCLQRIERLRQSTPHVDPTGKPRQAPVPPAPPADYPQTSAPRILRPANPDFVDLQIPGAADVRRLPPAPPVRRVVMAGYQTER